MQVNKDSHYRYIFLLHIQNFSFSPFNQGYNARRTLNQHSWFNNSWINKLLMTFAQLLTLNQIKQDPTQQFHSCQTVSLAQGTSSRTCSSLCSFRQILGVNVQLLCKAASSWSCGHVSLWVEPWSPSGHCSAVCCLQKQNSFKEMSHPSIFPQWMETDF